MSRRKARRPDLKLIKNEEPQIDPYGFAKVDLSGDSEKVVIKEVPAKVDGTIVGTAQIYEDQTIGIVLNDDVPQNLLDKIKATAGEFGYTLGLED